MDARSDRFGASAAKRARIVLLAAEGVANTRIAELVDATVTTVLQLAAAGIRSRDLAGSVGCAPSGTAARAGSPRDRDRDLEAATEEARGDALVHAGCWPTG